MAATKQETDMDIVLFPFMAQGHIIPFLALALHLERKTNNNTTITIVNTPFNINKLRASLPPHSNINLLEIPFNPSDHLGLPPNTENTDSLPYPLVIRLLQASTSLKPSFKLLLQNLILQHQRTRPLCIIADIFLGWTASVAKDLGAFHVIFSISGGYGMACYYSLWFHLPRLTWQHHDQFVLPDFPDAGHIHKTQLPANISEADGTDAWSLFQSKNLTEWAESDGILFNTLGGEVDSVGLTYFTRKLGLPVWTVGPVVLSTGIGGGGCGREIAEWLDGKAERSVVYVSFGSMNTVTEGQMIELAKALEGCGWNFIWVVRPPIGKDINSEFKAEEWLPEGMVGRVKESGKGLIVTHWAPQVDILSHKAVAAFLSHCGWNSVLEALTHGVPILGWPMAAEQFFNCKFLEERLGVCVEVARGKTCEVRHQDIAAAIDNVMSPQGNGKGAHMRSQALRLRDTVATALRDDHEFTGSSVQALRHFLSAAANSTKTPSPPPHTE